ncbi:NAD-glutamate dehydrogenase [Pandoraea pulmonicola]|uniref:NAD-glutamate dehydrogenase n=1 Tax=Pandoraea pulmonicola TaxID=93221 RepID=A0AAJ4ZG41_PANPU|nr:NAD-glutamate dehydrogenase [Pandoraea pulmonicola]AJC19337.1 NAD-glutamate dehydrogenase [Pandoraea pulmonicola]SUA92679.1 NAD-specific glutamate dehydrogenase [Pandoraea pulmonicola]
MPANQEEKVRQHMVEVVAMATERAPEVAVLFEPFVLHYYELADADDVVSRSVADLYGAAMAHWQLGQKFVSGEPRIRIYNPTLDQHGWHCGHTVIEIVNDDMPFLVDSVTMEINRQGLALHSAFHPVYRVRRDASGKRIAVAPGAGLQRAGASTHAVAQSAVANAGADVGALLAGAESGESGAAGRNGHVSGAGGAAADGSRFESYIHIEVDRFSEPERIQALADGLQRVLGDVRAAVDDWRAMQAAAHAAIESLAERAAHTGVGEQERTEIDEAQAFLDWMLARHFTFLGYRDYELVERDGEHYLQGVAGTGLGVLRESRRDASTPDITRLSQGAIGIVRASAPIFLTKANSRATVHRPGYLDYVGVKRFDAQGRVCGERRFLGLYTSTVYMVPAEEIPLVRRKVAEVIGRTGFLPNGHLAKTLVTILEQYPRDELFQIDVDQLADIALGILRLQERQRTRLFVRRDRFDRYVSCLVFVPREKFNTDLRVRVQNLLQTAYHGTSVEFTPQLSESMLARIHITVRTEPGHVPDVDVGELEARIVETARRWQDDLSDALREQLGEERGTRALRRYAQAFPAGYREDYAARVAVRDVELIEPLLNKAPAAPAGSAASSSTSSASSVSSASALAMQLYRPLEAAPGTLRFKIYQVGEPIALSRSLPMLEHLGVQVNDERPYRIEPADASVVWMHDFGMTSLDGADVDLEHARSRFEDAFARIWAGDVENDDLNRLVLQAMLTWREVRILRAYAKYIRQVGSTFSNAYIENALTGNPSIAGMLVRLFLARFDPALGEDARASHAERLRAQIHAALEDVPNLDEDRILRQFLGVLEATLRTNYFQPDKDGLTQKPYLSFKFDPSKVPGLPEPKPMFEIWVYSPRVEGVHLRGGRVARGGLRWSDRREDFRTEVLGLVKAQMVKNTVIVPVGSKGGFVVKQPPPSSDRDAYLAEGVACYQTFLRGLLDLTDNYVDGRLVAPPNTVRVDGDDPYLVVAADKGTATFSDYANAISAEYGFWLGDAFASGGSVGYDHKKMAITARGAWESVKRHFSEMGVDTQTQDFTVVGIGDMSGDVFGNGMLLSKHIRLMAAFDHRHIFLDPSPDAATSFAERERLFQLPRSSWADYDTRLISAGGGVFPRTAKVIALSPQVREWLGTEATEMTPNDLLRALLTASVDLLYNGGIGTYVKASTETHAQVGDRANDGLRVNGAELRCKVVAEGGNLGLTQLGRIEYAQHGGRINTDAIDNSAGVDCSDHEVNIKILLGLVVTDGEMTLKQRNALLAEMTEEVGMLVLRDNYLQTQALSLGRLHAAASLDGDARFMRYLERAQRLARAIEFLPDDETLDSRRAAGAGLTSPERAVLMAYSKMWLYDVLLASDLPDADFVAEDLPSYFPTPLASRCGAAMLRHPLKREILATMHANALVNRAGVTFVHRLSEETGAEPADVVRASLAARGAYGLDALWREIDALDAQVSHETQAALFAAVSQWHEQATLWFLRRRLTDVPQTVERLRGVLDPILPTLDTLVSGEAADEARARRQSMIDAGVPAPLAQTAADIGARVALLDIAEVASTSGCEPALAAQVYFALDAPLGYGWLHAGVLGLPMLTHWQRLARATLLEELSVLRRRLTASVLALDEADGAGAASALEGADMSPAARRVARWQLAHADALARYHRVLADQVAAGNADLAMLSVSLKALAEVGR